MLLALLLAANLAEWIPARWNSNDPRTLEIVAETPVNCLLLEQPLWTAGFVRAAAGRGIIAFGVARPGADLDDAAARARDAGLAGVVLEGAFPAGAADSLRGKIEVVIELPPRALLRFDRPVVGTAQGIWPGVRVEAKAAATGGPWIDTNSGFLRFLRAATDAPIWIGVAPPPNQALRVERYLQAIGDAALAGARWIVALDDGFSRRLLAREAAALRDWRRIGEQLRFFEERGRAAAWRPHGQLALVQEAGAGALLSGGILDMIATKHTPVRAVPLPKLSAGALAGAKMAVNVDPSAASDDQREVMRAFTRAGGTMLSGPPGWKLPAVRQDQVTLDKHELEQIDEIWKGINSIVGRANLGVRLFNVAGMLSNLVADASGKRLALYLVNYTDYPVENVTVHLLGKFARARLYAPGIAPKDLEPYAIDEGTGIDVPVVGASAVLVME